MEIAAIAGLFGLGYVLTQSGTKPPGSAEEGFTAPIQATEQPYTMPTQPPFSGQQQKAQALSPSLSAYYSLTTPPSSATTPPFTAVTPQVRINDPDTETPPVYNSGKTIISALTGLPIPAEEFTHSNMVPFYRGQPKQNMTDHQNRSILDDHVGAGSLQITKREQAPLFDPHKEPTGNVFGMAPFTDFVQDRIVASTNRAGERPVEPVQVAPGIGMGYSALGAGGFQQFEVEEIMRQRKTVDELRVASDPKVTYAGVVVPGKSTATQYGTLGETRKYRPDTFYLNQDGERNFGAVGEVSAQMERPAQVLPFQNRQDTSTEAFGPAVASDFKSTYVMGSYRAPMTQQHDSFGFRNADGSTYGSADTDAGGNDYGRAGYDLPTNQRNVTSERGQTLNLTVAGGQKAGVAYDPTDVARATVRETTGANEWLGSAVGSVMKMTVYDPNDVARTTIRETTSQNDWIGGAAPVGPTKLTVYDPTEITRITTRNTNAEPDRQMNITRAGVPGAPQLAVPDGFRRTTKEEITARSAYTGIAGVAGAKGEQVYDFAYAMSQSGEKETVAKGRKPIAGSGLLSLFNGESFMNVTYRKLDSDSLNDRAVAADRVTGIPIGAEAIGSMRPPQELHVSTAQRNLDASATDILQDNPYALPLHRIAAGQMRPTEMALAGFA